MPQTKTPTNRHRSRSIIMQPADIVALTADEAIADIENCVRALEAENRNGTEPEKSRS